jgi:1-deoxy-D-xylulose 5-phosphate reductoisomerase
VCFPDIWRVVEDLMNRHTVIANPNLDAILEADQWARNEAQGCVKSLNR